MIFFVAQVAFLGSISTKSNRASIVFTLALALGLTPALVSHAQAGRQARTGKVTYVADGDSIYIGNWEIRLAAIDAPEYDQPYGQKAKQAVFDMVDGRSVRIVPVTTDDHGRTVAHVYRDDGLHVNAAMVEKGAAWVYRRYTNDPSLIDLENEAKRGKKGLWGLSSEQRMSPEQWRRAHQGTRAAFDCANEKIRCRQMKKCEEAQFYFRACNHHWLDRDKDGIPCEHLCKR